MFVLGKITAGLLSVKTTGKIADTLIFEKWKDKQTVKRYAIPKNPNTAKQQAQRSYMVPVIEAWHNDGYTSDDKEAWDYYAKIIKVNATGYNMFTRFRINTQKEGKTWVPLTDCRISNITGEGCIVSIDIASDETGVLFYGSSKVALYKQVVGVFDTDHYTFTIAGLDLLTRYYFYVKNTSPGEAARTGIYGFKTSKYIPVIITMGNEPIWRNTSVGLGYTLISSKNPANADGRIKQIELYTAPGGGNFAIGIFDNVVSNVFSTRSYINLGFIDRGYSSHSVDLEVKEGDYIGFYSKNGSVVVEHNPGEYWVLSGDRIPCENVTFLFRTFVTLLSLKGTGVG